MMTTVRKIGILMINAGFFKVHEMLGPGREIAENAREGGRRQGAIVIWSRA